jgi:hypothetical protein
MTQKTDKALVLYMCLNCSGTNDEEKCRNQLYCGGGKMRLECSSQPHFPHTNEKLWKEKMKKGQ